MTCGRPLAGRHRRGPYRQPARGDDAVAEAGEQQRQMHCGRIRDEAVADEPDAGKRQHHELPDDKRRERQKQTVDEQATSTYGAYLRQHPSKQRTRGEEAHAYPHHETPLAAGPRFLMPQSNSHGGKARANASETISRTPGEPPPIRAISRSSSATPPPKAPAMRASPEPVPRARCIRTRAYPDPLGASGAIQAGLSRGQSAMKLRMGR